ncbi:MAG: multidrug effflux MFS transporter [Verrucomicrobiales bacterium]|nr:multidrug effflux MFS transporter [Verrucomicrobiales bacterium]
MTVDSVPFDSADRVKNAKRSLIGAIFYSFNDMPTSELTEQKPRLRLIAICVLALLSAVAPIATDMYLPGFPLIAEDLNAGASGVLLTLTSFLVGLALGQLIIGPVSDRYGRRIPLLVGTLLAIVSGFLCAVVPNIGSLVVLRALQGFGGAAGVVLARAIIADRAPDMMTAARQTQIMMVIGGVAPILAPITGTFIVSAAGWRTVFVVIASLSLIAFAGVLRFIDESLPEERRIEVTGAALRGTIKKLFQHRLYVGYTLVTGFSFMALFGYISASSFVFQNVLGLSPTQFAFAFGANAFGIILFGSASAQLVSRIPPRRLILISLTILLIAALTLLILVVAGAGPVFILPATFLAVASVGPILGNSSALAIRAVPETAGMASAVLGALQFGLGALATPLVGLRGESDALPMSLVMASAGVASLIAFVFLTRSSKTAVLDEASPCLESC